MTNSFKKCFLFGRKLILFYVMGLCLCPLGLYSETPSDPAYLWEEMRQTTDPVRFSDTQNFKSQNEQVTSYYFYLRFLLTQQKFQEHFIAQIPNFKDKNIQLSAEQIEGFHFVSDFLDILNKASVEKIEQFVTDHNFTKADKIIIALVLIFNNRFGERIYDLMEAFGLSVNDTLAFKDINVFFIAEELQNSDNVAIVLSHHLAGTGDPEVLKKLFNTDYDPSIKNYVGENLLHSFIRSNNIDLKKTKLDYSEALRFISEHSQQLINEKDILGYTPLAVAAESNDKEAVEILTSKSLSADLQTRDNLNRDLIDLARLKKENKEAVELTNKNLSAYFQTRDSLNGDLIDLARLEKNKEFVAYLKGKISRQIGQNVHLKDSAIPSNRSGKGQAKGSVNGTDQIYNQNLNSVYFNFKPFIDTLINSIVRTNPQISDKTKQELSSFLSDLLNDFENERLQVINNFFHFDKTLAKTPVKLKVASLLEAIFNKDFHFFENISKGQKQLLETPFWNPTDGVNSDSVFVTNFFLEAIRNSFLFAVEYILNNHHVSNWAPDGESQSLSLDPLSLSLLTYASMPEEHPFKGEARDIIRLVADHTDVNTIYNFPLGFSPITWSVLLGLEEEAKFLHEKKRASLDFYLEAKDDNWTMDLIDYTQLAGFLSLGQYLQSKRKQEVSECQRIFIQ